MFGKIKISVVLVFLLSVGAFTATPVETHGALRVQNGKIVGKSGSVVQLTGMSFFWSNWQDKYWNPSVVEWLATDWNSTVVRAAMGVENENGYLDNAGTNEWLVERVVEAAIEQGIYVIIDWHDHNANNHTTQARTFFRYMAQKIR
jgi:endoglucanase